VAAQGPSHCGLEAPTAPGRFKGNKLYTDRFWKECYLDGADTLVEACDAQGDGTTAVSAPLQRTTRNLKSSTRNPQP
jgi:hypothetical protein